MWLCVEQRELLGKDDVWKQEGHCEGWVLLMLLVVEGAQCM